MYLEREWDSLWTAQRRSNIASRSNSGRGRRVEGLVMWRRACSEQREDV